MSYIPGEMIRLSKRTEYGLIALKYIGAQSRPVSVAEISRRFKIPREILAKVLQKLGREGLICSTQGVTGGYELSLPLEHITLAMVIRAVEGPIVLTSCAGEGDKECDKLEVCNVHIAIKKLQPRFFEFFDNITLNEF